MGALVTLELAEDSPILDLPWIITFGPLRDEDQWEPVVCGPYERPHALALGESVVADEELMAVVEPLLPRITADEIRGEIAAARTAAADEVTGAEGAGIYRDEYDNLTEEDFASEASNWHAESRPAPSPDELRAGLARIADLLRNVGR